MILFTHKVDKRVSFYFGKQLKGIPYNLCRGNRDLSVFEGRTNIKFI